MCRNPSKLTASDKGLCKSITVGDASKHEDVAQTFSESKADYVILATGNGMDLGKSDTREKTGGALAHVMKQSSFQDVKALVISSNGAGESIIKFGLGIGSMISYHLRHVLSDHTLQEKAFSELMDRTLIIRHTSLTDGKAGKTLVEFGDKVKGPSIESDRSEIAAWVTNEISKDSSAFRGRKVNLTSAKK